MIFLSLFVCCTNMKCENILTDIPSYYSYVHVQYLLGAISIFLFSLVINERDAFLQICTFLPSNKEYDGTCFTKFELILLSAYLYKIINQVDYSAILKCIIKIINCSLFYVGHFNLNFTFNLYFTNYFMIAY